MDAGMVVGVIVGWIVGFSLMGFTDLNGILIAGLGFLSAFVVSAALH